MKEKLVLLGGCRALLIGGNRVSEGVVTDGPVGGGHLLKLSLHSQSPRVWNVVERKEIKGPPTVSSYTYRKNYNRIFGGGYERPN